MADLIKDPGFITALVGIGCNAANFGYSYKGFGGVYDELEKMGGEIDELNTTISQSSTDPQVVKGLAQIVAKLTDTLSNLEYRFRDLEDDVYERDDNTSADIRELQEIMELTLEALKEKDIEVQVHKPQAPPTSIFSRRVADDRRDGRDNRDNRDNYDRRGRDNHGSRDDRDYGRDGRGDRSRDRDNRGRDRDTRGGRGRDGRDNDRDNRDGRGRDNGRATNGGNGGNNGGGRGADPGAELLAMLHGGNS